ncbi:MAG: WYL domain-containing protein, partial [Bacteroidales bacterium]|nr:WYL domain-containing protein [Bacteroidales bacterium]
MDQPKIERMLRLMKMMAGNRNYTIDELAEKLGTSYRSIYRYIDTFKDCGFVVNKVRSNVYKLGKLPKSYVELKNLIYFSEEEAYVVNGLINSLDATNMLKANLKKKLSAVYDSTSIVKYVQKSEVAEHIEQLGEAIRSKRKVILKAYESAHSQEVADRFIEPFELTTNCIDVWGFDLEKQENRVFKISRIGKVCLLQDSWSNEESHQTSKTDCFRISSFEQSPVKLELSLMAKSLLVEEYPLAEMDLRHEDDKWILETMVSGMEGVGRFVLGLLNEIKIIDSPALEDYIDNYVNNFLKHKN